MELGRGPYNSAVSIEHERVAAVEHGQRRKGVQTGIQRFQGVQLGVQSVLNGTMEMIAVEFKPLARLGQGPARIVMKHRGVQGVDMILPTAQLCHQSVLQTAA